MARYYGTLQGNRGPASRLGTPNSGLTTTTNGWNIGVTCYANPAFTNDPSFHTSNADYIDIDMTKGSSCSANNFKNIGHVLETPDGPVFTPSTELLQSILSGKPNLSL